METGDQMILKERQNAKKKKIKKLSWNHFFIIYNSN